MCRTNGPHVLYRGAGALVLVSVAVFCILAAVDVEGSATIRASGSPSRETRRRATKPCLKSLPDDVDEESTALPAVPCTNELGGTDGDPTKEIEWVVGGDGSLRSQCSEHLERGVTWRRRPTPPENQTSSRRTIYGSPSYCRPCSATPEALARR